MIPSQENRPLTLLAVVALQGTGRYSIYLANYASGNVGPHALLEMDEAASDVPNGIIALSDVAATAGVNKLTGRASDWKGQVCDVLKCPESAQVLAVVLSVQVGAVWLLDQS